MTSKNEIVNARINHDDQMMAHRVAAQQEQRIRRRSRREWQCIWWAELETFRSKWGLISDRLGIVWRKDRAQLILYSSPPQDPLKEFSLGETMDSHHLVSRKQGLLAWSTRKQDEIEWIAARDTEKDWYWYRFLDYTWPNDEIASSSTPITSVDNAVWLDDIVAMLDNGWTCRRNPARGFWGSRQKVWLLTCYGVLISVVLTAIAIHH